MNAPLTSASNPSPVPAPTPPAIDPVTLAVLQSGLQQVCNEMDLAFVRAAFSPSFEACTFVCAATASERAVSAS